MAPGLEEAAFGGHDADLIHNFNGESAIGPRIVVYCLVHDEFGRGTGGALVAVWQANAGGRYQHNKEGYGAAFDSNFGGCGRVISEADRKYEFRTIMPKPYPWARWMWPPSQPLAGAVQAERQTAGPRLEPVPLGGESA